MTLHHLDPSCLLPNTLPAFLALAGGLSAVILLAWLALSSLTFQTTPHQTYECGFAQPSATLPAPSINHWVVLVFVFLLFDIELLLVVLYTTQPALWGIASLLAWIWGGLWVEGRYGLFTGGDHQYEA